MLLNNIEKLHTTKLGVERIRRNIGLKNIDVVSWCKDKVLDPSAIIKRRGKNWYVQIDGYIITINVSSYTIITCHIEKKA